MGALDRADVGGRTTERGVDLIDPGAGGIDDQLRAEGLGHARVGDCDGKCTAAVVTPESMIERCATGLHGQRLLDHFQHQRFGIADAGVEIADHGLVALRQLARKRLAGDQGPMVRQGALLAPQKFVEHQRDFQACRAECAAFPIETEKPEDRSGKPAKVGG